MQAGNLVADNGAEFNWDNTDKSKPYFSFNKIAYDDFYCEEKDYATEIVYGDCSENGAWGSSNDFSPIHDTILHNVGIFIAKYPETKQQFLNFLLENSKHDS
jgi:hypothetical protein